MNRNLRIVLGAALSQIEIYKHEPALGPWLLLSVALQHSFSNEIGEATVIGACVVEHAIRTKVPYLQIAQHLHGKSSERWTYSFMLSSLKKMASSKSYFPFIQFVVESLPERQNVGR